MQHTRVLIADDHKMFADGLVSILDRADGIVIKGVAASGTQLLELLATEPADVVLLDISMPGMNGDEAAKEIIGKYPHTRILVVTMHHTYDVILPLVRMGVHGIVLKNTGKSELLTAIESLVSGRSYFSQDIAQKLANHYRHEQQSGWVLTKREKEVLKLIYEGLSSAEIADKLFISHHTVETHRKNLLSKTGSKNATQLINMAIKAGVIS